MKKVAIVRRNGLGDLLLTMPLLHALKNEQDVSLTLFVDQRNAPLIPYLPKVFDRLIMIPKGGNKYFTLVKFALSFRKEKFDVAISAKTSPMKLMNFFLFALGAKKRIAFVDQKISSCLINGKIPFDVNFDKSTHQAVKAIKLVGYEKLEQAWYPKLSIPEELKAKYPNPFDDSPVLLMSASTTNATSRIDPAKYASAVNRLVQKHRFSLLLMGEKKDDLRLSQISEKLEFPHICLFPRNFDEFMVLQSYCDLYFVPDGGPAHIGAGLQKSQVILFGRTPPALWAPLSTKAVCLFHKEHVDHLKDEEIYEALCAKFVEVERGRMHL